MSIKSANYLANLAEHDDKDGMEWDSSLGVLRVKTPQALIQAVGYPKYARRQDGIVLFRGQNRLYESMRPSLYRKLEKQHARRAREDKLDAYIEEVRQSDAFLANTPEYAHEPILQHYGIHTRWLDLVDNAWSALWFACHDAFMTGHRNQYLHFEPSRERYAYIVLLQAGLERPDPSRPGHMTTDHAEMIDLRRAAPSNYLRPHAQHAYLIRAISPEMEMISWVIGIIGVEMRWARKWLGHGLLSETRYFFPSPYYDGGYEKLLKLAPESDFRMLGSLYHVGA